MILHENLDKLDLMPLKYLHSTHWFSSGDKKSTTSGFDKYLIIPETKKRKKFEI